MKTLITLLILISRTTRNAYSIESLLFFINNSKVLTCSIVDINHSKYAIIVPSINEMGTYDLDYLTTIIKRI